MNAWLKQVVSHSYIHEQRQLVHGKAKPGPQRESSWKLKDTARELKISITTLSQDIFITRSLELFPRLKDFDSRRQALTFLKKQRR